MWKDRVFSGFLRYSAALLILQVMCPVYASGDVAVSPSLKQNIGRNEPTPATNSLMIGGTNYPIDCYFDLGAPSAATPKGWAKFSVSVSLASIDQIADDTEKRCWEYELDHRSQDTALCPLSESEFAPVGIPVVLKVQLPRPNGMRVYEAGRSYISSTGRATFSFAVYACNPEAEHSVSVSWTAYAQMKDKSVFVYGTDGNVAVSEYGIWASVRNLSSNSLAKTTQAVLPINIVHEADTTIRLYGDETEHAMSPVAIHLHDCNADESSYYAGRNDNTHQVHLCDRDWTSGSAIAHELGHALAADLVGSAGVTSIHQSDYSRSGPGHTHESLEYASPAFLEGVAHFLAMLRFNACGDSSGEPGANFSDYNLLLYYSGSAAPDAWEVSGHPGHAISRETSGMHIEGHIARFLCDLRDRVANTTEYEPYLSLNYHDNIQMNTGALLAPLKLISMNYPNVTTYINSLKEFLFQETGQSYDDAIDAVAVLNSIWNEGNEWLAPGDFDEPVEMP